MSNNIIRVGITPDPPYSMDCAWSYPEKCPNPGVDIEFIHTVLTGMLHLNVSWVPSENYSVLYEGMNGDVIDLIGLSAPLTSAYHAYFSNWYYSPIVFRYDIGFIVKYTTVYIEDRVNIFERFKKELWTVLLLTTITILALKLLTRKLKIYWPHFRLVYFIWFVILTLVIETYGNLITVSMVTSGAQIVHPFSNISDLGNKIAENKCRFALLNSYMDGPEFYQTFFEPNHNRSWAKIYKYAYEVNKPILTDNREDMVTFVKNSTCVVGLDLVGAEASFYNSICGISVKTFSSEILTFSHVFYHSLPHLVSNLDTVVSSDSIAHYGDSLLKQYFYSSPMNDCKVDTMLNGILSFSQLFHNFLFLFLGCCTAGMPIFMYCVVLSLKRIISKQNLG